MSLTRSRRSSSSNTITPVQKNQDEKFPVAQLFLLALVRVAEPIAITSIFPYAWKLVLHFNVGSPSNASFYAGILISSFNLAEALSGIFWGGLSDKLGRKPVLVIGCTGTILSLLIVGISTNFWMALAGRIFGGILNGNVGVIQTMVSEIVTNPKHEPKAYAVMPFVWSVGTILGPSIGGYFAEPAVNFPRYFSSDGLFAKFPYLLPNLLCAGLMFVSIVAGWLCLKETHPDKQPGKSTADEENATAPVHYMPTQPTANLPAANIAHDDYGTFADIEEEPEEWRVNPDGTTRAPSLISTTSTTEKVFSRRIIMLTVALGIFTYHSMTYDHLQPIFFQDARVPSGGLNTLSTSSVSSFAGGLGLTVQQVGIVLSVNGLIAMFIQAVIFPIFTSYLGVWKTFMVTAIGHPLAYFIVPFLVYLPEHLLYPGLYCVLTVRNFFSILAYPVLLILIKEATPNNSSLGKINGLAASTGAGCRTIASPIAGFLYGVGINIDFTPLAWWASALVAVVGAVQCFFINERKSGRHHEIHPAFTSTKDRERRRSSVLIRVQCDDSGYNSIDERTPLRPSRSQEN